MLNKIWVKQIAINVPNDKGKYKNSCFEKKGKCWTVGALSSFICLKCIIKVLNLLNDQFTIHEARISQKNLSPFGLYFVPFFKLREKNFFSDIKTSVSLNSCQAHVLDVKLTQNE